MFARRTLFAWVPIALLAVMTPCAARADLLPGDVLTNVFVSSVVKQFRSDGTLVQTIPGAAGSGCSGLAFSPQGNIVTGYSYASPPAIATYTPNGSLLKSFNISQSGVMDVSVFPDGNIAVTDDSSSFVEYTPQGAVVRSVRLLPTNSSSGLWGSVVAPDGSLWVGTDSPANQLFHVTETGTVLATLNLSFEPGDIAIDPLDQSLWVPNCASTVWHLSPSGTTLGSFAATNDPEVLGIAFSPDGNSIYLNDNRNIDRYSRTGVKLGSFSTGESTYPATFVAVVVPEPTCAAGLIMAFALGRRRRRV